MNEVTSARPSDRVAQLQSQLTDEVARLVDSTAWREMLAAAAKFHHYSLGNQLLIAAQRPDASRVAGYKRWAELGRQVRRGERGIAILAPCVAKSKDDPDAPPTVRGFRTTFVFDISQTDGPALPEVRPQLLTGEGPSGLWNSLAQLVAAEGYALALEPPSITGANGETSWSERTVRVRPDLSPAARCKTLAHELGHIRCGHFERRPEGLTREVAEVEAESVAYVVLAAVDVDAGEYSAPYVAGWGGSSVEAVKECAQRVVEVSRRILDDIDADRDATPLRNCA